jgi:hypothetical protein
LAYHYLLAHFVGTVGPCPGRGGGAPVPVAADDAAEAAWCDVAALGRATDLVPLTATVVARAVAFVRSPECTFDP